MTDILIWAPEMSVGNADIDFQHKKILDAANMVRGLSGAEDRDIILAALDEVVEYTLAHFAFEEAALKSCGFSGFVEHKALHDGIRECVQTVARNRDLVTAEMLDDVMSRLVHHILSADQDYVGEVGYDHPVT